MALPIGAASPLPFLPILCPVPAVVTNATGSVLTQPAWGATSPSPRVSALVPGEVEGITQHALGTHKGHDSLTLIFFVSRS